MKITNLQIYQTFTNLKSLDNFTQYIPARANFFLQKNIQLITKAAQEIEQARLNIAQHYGELEINNSQQYYKIPEDKREEAEKELENLFLIEQELDIKTFKIEDLGNVEFTPIQMQAILFMIED